MAFVATLTTQTVVGNKKLNMGTYTQGNGDTGGAIVTGLKTLEFFSATGATKTVNASGTVTITTADPLGDVSGFWQAIGY